jgi:hypothetical protein
MAVSQDKCITCTNRRRPTDLEQISPSGALDPDGTFMGLPYWFCSLECYKKSIRKFLNPRYDFDKKPQNDEDYCSRIEDARVEYYVKARSIFSPVAWRSELDYIKPEVDKAFDAFQTKKFGEITGAEIELHQRLFAEWQHQIDEEQADRDKEHTKLQDQS